MSVLYNYIGVGDITYASTESVLDLIELYRNLEDLEASGGGDTPEYSLMPCLKLSNLAFMMIVERYL